MIVSVSGVMVLMENSVIWLKWYVELLVILCYEGKKIGCIVMNVNFFMNGYCYLI